MGAVIPFVQGELGDLVVGQRDLVRVAWLVYGKKKEESVESSTIVPILDNLEGEKQKIF